MTATGLEVFDDTLHKTNTWLKEIAQELSVDRHGAYQLLRAVLMRMDKPGAIGRVSFEVSWAGGQPIGVIEQENLLFEPQFSLAAADGTSARLTGGMAIGRFVQG